MRVLLRRYLPLRERTAHYPRNPEDVAAFLAVSKEITDLRRAHNLHGNDFLLIYAEEKARRTYGGGR